VIARYVRTACKNRFRLYDLEYCLHHIVALAIRRPTSFVQRLEGKRIQYCRVEDRSSSMRDELDNFIDTSQDWRIGYEDLEGLVVIVVSCWPFQHNDQVVQSL